MSIAERVDVLEFARAEAARCWSTRPSRPKQVWDSPGRAACSEGILDKRIKLYTVDATTVAREAGLPGRTNTVLQTCFFAISGVLPKEEAISKVKASIRKTYGRRGEEVVRRNEDAVDAAVSAMHEVPIPDKVSNSRGLLEPVPAHATGFVKSVTAAMLAGKGDDLPVSSLPDDGSYPSGTTQFEKRNVSDIVAEWDEHACIQCGNCSLVCPHAVIRSKWYRERQLDGAPESFQSAPLDAVGHPRMSATPCRCTSRTAPAADCASRPARSSR
jgi:pyruvate-ferredoxin/flavodoxin oxidoreductase